MQRFDCKCCGDCCSGEMIIRLNIYDLYKIGKELGYSQSKELFSNGYVELMDVQNGIEVPVIKFKKTPYSFCPFLINSMDDDMNLKGYCSLHPYKKPLVCILAPISRVYDTDKEESEFFFTKPTENCPGKLFGEDILVDEILEPVKEELKYEEKFYKLLDKILTENISDYQKRLYYFPIEDLFTFPEFF